MKTNIVKFNALFLTGLTLFMLLWRVVLGWVVPRENTSAWLIWSTGFIILLFIGSFFAFLAWKFNLVVELRKAIGIIGLGLFLQGVAGIVFGFIQYISDSSGPYPTFADLLYSISYFLYLVAIILVTKKYVSIAKAKYFSIVLFIVATPVVLLDFKILRAVHFIPGLDYLTGAVFGYVFFESLFSIIAISLVVFTKFFKGTLHRLPLNTLVLGLVLNYAADLNFVYSALGTGWNFGAFEDIIYIPAYFVIALAMIIFLNVSVAFETLLITVNTYLVFQVLFFYKTGNVVSNTVILLLSLASSFVLFRQNKSFEKLRENEIRLHALEESNAKLTELDQQKTEFLNIAAHQLRTPVSIIRNYVSMMQDGDYGEVPEQIKEVHNNIYQSNQWLVRLADEFLNLSKLESGQLKYHMEKADLAKAVDEVVQEILPKATQKGLTLELIRPTEPVLATFDIEKIKHATMNLVENAVKYTPAGSIAVKVTKDATGVYITVTDTGIGVPPQDIPNLFQKFRRGQNAHEIEVNTSTGLGLYIARKFVEGHGGRVWVKSDGEGKGSEFGYWLHEKQQ